MSKYSDFLTEQLKDPALKAEYDALEPEFSVIQAMIDARKAAGPTRLASHSPTSASWKPAVQIRLCGRCNVSHRGWA